MVYSTDRSKAMVPVLVLLFVALCLLYEAICFSFAWCYFVLVLFNPLSTGITSLGEELILVPFVRLFDLRLFGFVCFLFLLMSGKGCFSYVCSVCACLDLSVSSSSWGLGGAAVCDCGTPWTFLLPFFCGL